MYFGQEKRERAIEASNESRKGHSFRIRTISSQDGLKSIRNHLPRTPVVEIVAFCPIRGGSGVIVNFLRE